MTEENLNSLDGGGLFPRLQQRYGFRANPLDMEAPFFPDAMRHHALETLRHLCGFGDMALLLTGAPGSGKTRLLAELVRIESARLDFHRLPAAALSSSKALAAVLRELAPSSVRSGQSAREAVYSFFHWSESRVRKGQRMVLLIDDADRAPPELLRLILAGFLASERASAAVPVLAGGDDLVARLRLDAVSTNVHQIHLRPLTREEVVAYLEPRIHLAGGDAKQLLASSNVSKIHALSQGSFTRLQRVTPGVWLDMVPAVPKAGGSSMRPLKKLAWPLLALALLGGSWWFVSMQYEESMAADASRSPKQEPLRKSITVGPESPIEGRSADASPEVARVAPDTRAEPVREPVQKLKAGPVLEPESAPAPKSEPEPETGPETGRESKPEPVPASASEAQVGLGFSPENAAKFEPLDELKARGGWTIQLVAGNLEQTALTVLEQYPELQNAVYTRGERQGEPWFMVLYGQYPTKADARNAVAELPGPLRDRSPWVRSAAGL